jgi:hypothetical protein
MVLAVAAFVTSTPAVAQSWEEYRYPDYAFAVVFPANPQVEATIYQIADKAPCRYKLLSLRSATQASTRVL